LDAIALSFGVAPIKKPSCLMRRDGLSDKTPIEWNQLKNYEIFSLSSDGSFPLMKVSRSKAVRLSDREVLMVGGGRCYRVSFSNHYAPTF
jgi:hypothetical protein